MSLSKTLFGFSSIILAGIITYLALLSPESTLLALCLAAYGFLTYQKPFWGLAMLLLLPVLGEFSRFDLFGRSIVLSDLIIPIFEIASLFSLKKFIFPKSVRPVLITLVIFLSLAALSLLFSFTSLPLNEVLQSSLYLIRLIIYLGLFPLTYLIISPKNTKQLIIFIAISALLVAISGFIQLIYLPSLEELSISSGYDPHLNRLAGSWLDPNFIGGFFGIISIMLLSLSLYEKTLRLKIFYLSTSAILLISLFLTYSRSAYLAAATGILLLGLVKARKLLLILVILGTFGLSISDRAQERVGELVTSINSVLFNTSENPDPTARLRIQNWQDTWNLIGQKPLLGHGYNTLSFVKLDQGLISDEEIHSASGSDSSLLTILVTTGVLGLLPFLYFLWLLLKDSSLGWYQNKSSPLQKGFSLGLLCSLIALLIHSSFVNSILFPQIMIYFWIMLGLFYAIHSNKQSA